MDLSGRLPYTRHTLDFAIPVPQSTQSDQRRPDKEQLRSNFLHTLASGMSYREIAQVIGLHWTRRVQQIVKSHQ